MSKDLCRMMFENDISVANYKKKLYNSMRWNFLLGICQTRTLESSAEMADIFLSKNCFGMDNSIKNK